MEERTRRRIEERRKKKKERKIKKKQKKEELVVVGCRLERDGQDRPFDMIRLQYYVGIITKQN